MPFGSALFSPLKHTRPARVPLIVWATLCLSLAGCTPFAPGNNSSVQPRFDLPIRPTVFFVEPLSNDPQDVQFARQVAARATQQLRDNPELLTPPVIDTAQLVALQNKKPDHFAALSIDAIGRSVNAETVIHVRITATELNIQGPLYKPRATAGVRVIDALTGERLFPSPHASAFNEKSPTFPLSAGGSYESTGPDQNAYTAQARARHILADETGLALARMFYPWKHLAPGERVANEKEKYQRSRM